MLTPLRVPTAAAPMFAGLVGDIVAAARLATESADAAIAMQLLVAFGNAVGRQPYFAVGETRHRVNENVLIIGRSGAARKGDGRNAALSALRGADEQWAAERIASGLSSGEGLIHAVRDPVVGTDKKGEETVLDPGVTDKRLLVTESEFSQPLKMFQREGNILSNTIREAFDAAPVIQTLTKNRPARASGAHISIIGHATPEDLRRYLSAVETANGFANRFLYALVDRARELPSPQPIDPAILDGLTRQLRAVLDFAQRQHELRRSPAAERLWAELYPRLSADQPGLLGKLCARAAPHVVRLSALYALLAQASVVEIGHLKSALAVWDYSADSVKAIFADCTGDDVADRIRQEMLPGQVMMQSELRQHLFKNHVSAGRLANGLKLSQALGDIGIEHVATGGRPGLRIIRLPEAANDAAA